MSVLTSGKIISEDPLGENRGIFQRSLGHCLDTVYLLKTGNTNPNRAYGVYNQEKRHQHQKDFEIKTSVRRNKENRESRMEPRLALVQGLESLVCLSGSLSARAVGRRTVEARTLTS